MKRVTIALAMIFVLCATSIAQNMTKPSDMIMRESLPEVIELSGTDDASMQRIHDSSPALTKHVVWEIPDLGHFIAKQVFERQPIAVDQPDSLTNITENETTPEVTDPETEIINIDDIIYL